MIAGVTKGDLAVATGITYLFRTTGQVLGVSLSGTVLQAVLLQKLRERITGPNAGEVSSVKLLSQWSKNIDVDVSLRRRSSLASGRSFPFVAIVRRFYVLKCCMSCTDTRRK